VKLTPVLEAIATLKEGIKAPTKPEQERLAIAALDDRTRAWKKSLDARLAGVDAKIAELPKPHLVYAAANFYPGQSRFTFPTEPRTIHVLNRGSVESPGKLVNPGALSCVKGLSATFENSSDEEQRRIALARWITDPANVLDWLATTFRNGGGSIKSLHRLILLSSTYRQSSFADPANATIDAENRYYWRMNRTRLDAESIRDSVLAVSGKLDFTMGGPSQQQFFFKDDHSPIYDYARFDNDSPAANRRSVYRFVVRSVPDPFMERLDCPDASLITAKRNTTITAIQALALLNNPFVLKQAEHLAARIERSKDPIGDAYRLTLGRNPSPAERDTLGTYLRSEGLINLCRLLFNTNEFLFID
jgi:hypothetical protein